MFYVPSPSVFWWDNCLWCFNWIPRARFCVKRFFACKRRQARSLLLNFPWLVNRCISKQSSDFLFHPLKYWLNKLVPFSSPPSEKRRQPGKSSMASKHVQCEEKLEETKSSQSTNNEVLKTLQSEIARLATENTLLSQRLTVSLLHCENVCSKCC